MRTLSQFGFVPRDDAHNKAKEPFCGESDGENSNGYLVLSGCLVCGLTVHTDC